MDRVVALAVARALVVARARTLAVVRAVARLRAVARAVARVMAMAVGVMPAVAVAVTTVAVVGTLKDRYLCNVPLLRVPRIQSASPTMSHELIAPKVGISLSGYLHVPSWIPTLPKSGSIFRVSQRFL